MDILSIDIETFSDVDLVKSGVFSYTASPHFEIILFAYAFNDDEVKIIDLANGEKLPKEIIKALLDDNVIKTAFNAQFERICLSTYLNISLKPKSWQCTAVQAASLTLPLSLEKVSQILGLEEQKMKEGKELIKFFSVPCNPTKSNNNRTRNYPKHNIEKWEIFKKYCIRDVQVERAIRRKLQKYPLSENEQKIYALDQEINERGILVNMNLVNKAIECDKIYKEYIIDKAKNITSLDNPNSVQQIKQWLLKQGVKITSLSKKEVENIANKSSGVVKEFLNIRLQLAKTSIKKYEAIKRTVCSDNRVRGLFQFYGASRTGRWSGKYVQIQNLAQNHIKDLDLARNLVNSGDFETLELLYDSVPQVLSELIRTAFIPDKNNRFIVADFSAIEARVIAWLANEKWRMDVFSTHGKIYEASASHMFNVPIEEITKTSPLRQKGKVAELALGYGGSVGALTSMGALNMGVKEDELQNLVNVWRESNPSVTKLWWDIDKAAINVVKNKTSINVGKIKIYYEDNIMFIKLPSGRKLAYIKPRLDENKFGREGITYEGITSTKKWERIETYGPKLVENIVQGIARDLLAQAMINLSEKGYKIVSHVHDEVIIECPIGQGSLEDVCSIMSITPTWAKGLVLKADGFQCEYYRKD